jgi:hypothetical protein
MEESNVIKKLTLKKFNMKKIFSIATILAILSINGALAQESATQSTTSDANVKNYSKKENRQDKWQERYEKATPEQKAKMEKRREMLKNLSEDQKKLLKEEQQRHRQEVKKITGFEPDSENN